MTAPRQLQPADPTPLPPVAKPGVGTGIGVGRARTLPGNLQATQLPVAPMPPDLHLGVVRTSALLPTPAAISSDDLEPAPMPPELPRLARYALAPAVQR